MNAEITNIAGEKIASPGKPCLDVVAALMVALERAQAGETTGIFLVEATLSGGYYASLEGVASRVDMIGNVELLKFEYLYGMSDGGG